MKAVHLNLLRETEVLSSSPVRLRVMLPILAALASVAMLVWWGILSGQILMAKSGTEQMRADLERSRSANTAVMEKMQLASELDAELEQLTYYRNARHAWGETFTSLAEVMPLKVQLTRLTIPPPPPQNLANPKGPRYPALKGPTNTVDAVSLVLTGRTPRETPLQSLMDSLKGDAFTNALVITRDPRAAKKSPNVLSFRQESARDRGGRGMLAFEIEYTARERNFSK